MINIYKHLVSKNSASSCCLKSTHLCFLNISQRYLSKNVNDDSNIKALFKGYGFTEPQIAKLFAVFAKNPQLSSLSMKITKPKLDFFSSCGFSSSDFYCLLKIDPMLLRHSLENRIRPSFEFLKGVLKDNESVIAAVKRSSRALRQDLSKSVGPNMELLRNYGVPEYRILTMLRAQPRNLLQDTDKLRLILEKVKEMRFDPKKARFVDAIHLFTALSKSSLELKWDLYRKWGWSDEQIISAFRKQPFVMATSKDKIEQVLDFLVNQMGWNVSQISSCPIVLMHSLDNWTRPRCLVVQFLLLNGVINKDRTLISIISPSKHQFRKYYVNKFCSQFPELIQLYGMGEDNT